MRVALIHSTIFVTRHSFFASLLTPCGHSGCSAAFVTRRSACPANGSLCRPQASLFPPKAITGRAWLIADAVYLCCTVPGVASAGRYPASCPVKPGLSSPAVFRHLQPRSPVLLRLIPYYYTLFWFCKYFFLTAVFSYPKATSAHKFP